MQRHFEAKEDKGSSSSGLGGLALPRVDSGRLQPALYAVVQLPVPSL